MGFTVQLPNRDHDVYEDAVKANTNEAGQLRLINSNAETVAVYQPSAWAKAVRT